LGKQPFGILRKRCEDKIKIQLRQAGCEDGTWMEISQDYVKDGFWY
jgi:hypothetical protein